MARNERKEPDTEKLKEAMDKITDACKTCGGDGGRSENPCKVCKGTGIVKVNPLTPPIRPI